MCIRDRINTASRGMQLQHILANSGCVLLVADRASCPALAGVDATGLALRQIWLLEDGANDTAAVPPGLPAPAAALPALPDTPAPEADLGPGDTLAILYTSGTSGLSKGVCCPHAQFHWWGVIAARNLEIGADDVLYTSCLLYTSRCV